ncbi:MAG: OB-fold nucleic acid binding domain-containing protein [bacterium]|jgi:hypothetical protein
MIRGFHSVFLICLLTISCSRSEGGRNRTIRESIDLWTFSNLGMMIFDSVPMEEMRGVHLAGAGMINRDVLVKGRIEISGTGGTYLVLSDSSVRLLVDLTRVSADNNRSLPKAGRSVYVHGEVKSSERGHIYLLANAIRGG